MVLVLCGIAAYLALIGFRCMLNASNTGRDLAESLQGVLVGCVVQMAAACFFVMALKS
jgi:hypothetical protein